MYCYIYIYLNGCPLWCAWYIALCIVLYVLSIAQWTATLSKFFLERCVGYVATYIFIWMHVPCCVHDTLHCVVHHICAMDGHVRSFFGRRVGVVAAYIFIWMHFLCSAWYTVWYRASYIPSLCNGHVRLNISTGHVMHVTRARCLKTSPNYEAKNWRISVGNHNFVFGKAIEIMGLIHDFFLGIRRVKTMVDP